MSTNKSKQAVTVGFFVAIGIAILIIGIFTLGGQKKTFAASLPITAVFNNVSGLKKGDNVWFSGVKIGTVRSIEFYGRSKVKVTMNIDKKAHEYIRKDAMAKISSEGLIGSKLVVLYGGTEQAGPIEGKENIEVAEALNPEDIMATLQTNNKNVVEITTDLKAVSKRLANGEGSLGALLKDETLFKNLQTTVANLQTATRNSERLTKGIADYTSKLNRPGTLASDLVTDTAIMAHMRTAVEQVNLATASAAAFAHDLHNASERLEEKDNAVGVLLNDEQVARDLRTTIQNLNSSSQLLDENLEALQHNFLLRGFFRKKARQEARAAKAVTDSIRTANKGN
jgi:phospholipid/cholesterol/gamma-HCH transport system substrate-binding protein